MREVKIRKWSVKDDKGGVVREESTVEVLMGVLGLVDPNSGPRGIDVFRAFSKFNRAIVSARESGVLALDDATYLFVRQLVEKNIPSQWGLNENIALAVEDFLNATKKEEDVRG